MDALRHDGEERHFGDCFTSKDLSHCLKIGEGAVRAMLRELVDSEFMERVTMPREGKGRRAICYRITPSARADFERAAGLYGNYAKHLKQLFSGVDMPAPVLLEEMGTPTERRRVSRTGKPAPPGAKGRLTICNRLLLGSLLAHADQFGVVMKLSGSDLRRITGLDSESIRHRVQRLLDVGLIRSYVPGVSSSVFRKSKVNSIYYLNLNHAGYGLENAHECIVRFGPRFEREPVHQLKLAAWRERRQKTPLPTKLAEYLSGQKKAVFTWFRAALYQVASEYLTINLKQEGVDDDDYSSWMQSKVKALLKDVPDDAEDEVRDAFESIVKDVCKLVMKIVNVARLALEDTPADVFNSAEVMILYAPQSEGGEVATFFVRSGSPARQAIRVFHGLSDDLKVTEYIKEECLRLSDRGFFGLVATPVALAKRLSTNKDAPFVDDEAN